MLTFRDAVTSMIALVLSRGSRTRDSPFCDAYAHLQHEHSATCCEGGSHALFAAKMPLFLLDSHGVFAQADGDMPVVRLPEPFPAGSGKFLEPRQSRSLPPAANQERVQRQLLA